MMRRPPLVVLVLVLAARGDAAVFPCDEPGVLAALAAGGGPHTFSCGGPTTIVTSAELIISQSVELDGGGLLALSGGGAHRVISMSGFDLVASLRNLVLRDGFVPDFVGGCVYANGELTLENVEIHGCEALFGGGVATENGSLSVIDSIIRGNRGGGIARFQGGPDALVITRSRIRDNIGDGVVSGANALLTMTDSTVAGNVGTGISISYWGSVTISRSTISHNTGGGGGLVFGGGVGTVEDSTFVANLPVAMAFAQPPYPASDVQIRSSTVIGNTGTQPSAIVVGPEPPPGPHTYSYDVLLENTIVVGGCSGDVFSDGGNLVTPGCPYFQHVSEEAIHLGKLGPHGGPTWTVPLRAPSVAIDGAPGCLTATDQRGGARPFGAGCDVGAFEWDGPAPGEVPALPTLGVGVPVAALGAAGARALRARRPA